MNNVTDMTQGSSLKLILKFTVPLLIGNIFQQLYNMVDSVIVGKYVGANALAAVGSCGSVNFLFFSLSSGLAIGIGIMIAQYFGAKMEKEIRRTIINGAYLLTAASVIVTVISYAFAPQILGMLSTPDEIIADAIIYLRIISVGILSVSFYNGIAAVLRALGDSKSPLYFLILSSIVNVVLDLVFVLQCKMGVLGVGLATLISQIVAAITCLIYACIKVPYFKIGKEECDFDMDVFRSFW